jgi:putative membrane protein
MAEPWDDDDRVGLARGAARVPSHPSPLPPVVKPEEPCLREGDNELGRPIQRPLQAAPLTKEDHQRIAAAEDAEVQRALDQAEELMASDPALPWLGWFAHPIATALLLGSAAIFGLYLYSQTLSIIETLDKRPLWLQITGYTILGFLGCAILYAITRLLLVYLRLRVNRQLRLAGLEELHNRTQLRFLAHRKAAEAKQQLEQYLRDFPIDTLADQNQLLKFGFQDEHFVKLIEVRQELLDPARFVSTQEWFATFRDRFQNTLDQAAEARISYWSNRAMIVTALSPNAVVDSLSTLYFSFALLTDLCRVYNLRAGRTGTMVLLSRVFFNAYLSGQVNDFEKLAEEQYEQLFHQAFEVIGLGVSSNVVGKLLGKVGAKATTGYLNRLMLARLGKYSCRLLRPVA